MPSRLTQDIPPGGVASDPATQSPHPSFVHREAAYGGESRELANRHLKIILHKRVGGWGWGELYGSGHDNERPFLAILEHFGEIDFPAYFHPMRLEAEECQPWEREGRQGFTFPLRMQIPEEACMGWDNISPVHGRLELSLAPGEDFLRYHLEMQADFRVQYRYLRGPWLRVGAYQSGHTRQDAMFPGMEWLIGDEWSSGNDFFGPDLALRVTPHPHKVQIPLMTVATAGHTVTLAWPPRQNNLGTLERLREPQPVFASPNFIDRRPEHVLGLMYPTTAAGLGENTLAAAPALVFPRRAPLTMDAVIGVQPGNSLDAVVGWVHREGLPSVPPLRWPREEALDRIAAALNSHLWEEGAGWKYGAARTRSWMVAKPWGHAWLRQPHMYLHFVDWYVAEGRNRTVAAELAGKIEWCRNAGPFVPRPGGIYEMFRWFTDDQLNTLADQILAYQKPDGNFPYSSTFQAAHFAKQASSADRWKPMGQPGETVFDLCVTPAIVLLQLARLLNRSDCREAAIRALEFVMPIERPAGGDWWECPLQAPNLLSAAHGAIAYWLGWTTTGNTAYHSRARHFLRALLPFTCLWTPEEKDLRYETTALYGSTGWHYMAWTDRNVHWQILLAADMCDQLGFDWAAVDPDIDWTTYRRGVIAAGLRWLVDHTDSAWMYRCEDRNPAVVNGLMDMVLADVHDPVDDTYGGINLGLEPSWVASLLAKHFQPLT